MKKIAFLTGKLAEPALRAILAKVAPVKQFEAEVVPLPISVAALLTTKWISTHYQPAEDVSEIILPGLCSGDLALLPWLPKVQTRLGPKDLRDLPEFFGLGKRERHADYGQHSIEILAEINHAPRLNEDAILKLAERYRNDGAEIIDLGCSPGIIWENISSVVRRLVREGFRVSVDSFQSSEVIQALSEGAQLVLSVNSTNREQACQWKQYNSAVEVVAIPDKPEDTTSLEDTIRCLQSADVPFRADPILEPIGFGFSQSLGRYLNFRQKHPDVSMLLGVGNVTELTEVDSAGINVLLAAFCAEQRINSILTTEVINWARSSVKEFHLARQLVSYAVRHNTIPKHIDSSLVMLRDSKLNEYGSDGLAEIAGRIKDSNYRIFVERGQIFLLNQTVFLSGTDPFDLLDDLLVADPALEVSHAFYLGYELAKALTALHLNKQYRQDQALQWGFLTVPEVSHRAKKKASVPSAGESDIRSTPA